MSFKMAISNKLFHLFYREIQKFEEEESKLYKLFKMKSKVD